MAVIGSFIAANIGAIIATTVAVSAAATTAISVNQQNAQKSYQQKVAEQNAIAAQNKAAAEMKTRRTEVSRAQAATRAKMAATGVDSTSGSFLDLVGQGAAAGELDVLKAKHSGDIDAWSLNNQINELETNKKNAWLESSLAGAQAGISAASGLSGVGSGALSSVKGAATSGSAISMAGGNAAGNAAAIASGAPGYVGELPKIGN